MTEDQSIRWQKRTTSDIIEAVFTLYQMVIKSCWVWTATTELKQVVHTHRTSYPSSWSRGFGGLNPSPQYWIFTSVSVDFIPRFCLFTSAMVKLWHRTYPICDAPPWRSARRSFSPLQISNQNHGSYVWTESLSGLVSCRRKSYTGLVWTESEGHWIVHSLTITNESRRLTGKNDNFSNQNQEL